MILVIDEHDFYVYHAWRLSAMLWMSIIHSGSFVFHTIFWGIAHILIRTNFTVPTTSLSQMLLPQIMNREYFLPLHTRYNCYAFNSYALIKSRSMSTEAQPL